MKGETRLDGVALIAAEREHQRQTWGDDHDDTHTDGALAVEAVRWAAEDTPLRRFEDGLCATAERRRLKARIRQLVIAGALIAAEIDRLQRAEFPITEPIGTEEAV